MIYLCNSEYGNLAVYFDVHAMERQEVGFALSGTLGDGHYEGEVMIEVGVDVDIAFADHWLDRAGLDGFFGRVDKRTVEAALAAAARTVVGGQAPGCNCSSSSPRSTPHAPYRRRPEAAPLVSSGEASWPAPM